MVTLSITLKSQLVNYHNHSCLFFSPSVLCLLFAGVDCLLFHKCGVFNFSLLEQAILDKFFGITQEWIV